MIANDKRVGSNTVNDFKKINNQSLATQAKKGGEQLVSMMPAIEKVFNLLDDELVELSTEKESSKNKIASYDEK